jgi:hypothetical protein
MLRRWPVILALLTVLWLTACTLPGNTEDRNKERAQPIIDALEQYQATNSSYPSDLSELVPQFLSRLPSTAGGQQFTYDTRTDHGYELGFTDWLGRGCGYIGEYKTWECSEGAP